MATERSPAFQFYPGDWLSDVKVRALTYEAKGVYIDLLCYCWQEGALPSDLATLARILAIPVKAFETRLWPQLRPCFTPTDAGWVQKRVEREREKQATFRTQMSAAGKRGNAKRWASPGDSQATEEVSPGDNQAVAKHRSPSPSPSPSLYGTPKSGVPMYAQPAVEPTTGRAEALWERWRQLLRETRKTEAPLTPRAVDQPKLLEALALVPNDADLHERLDRFMHLEPAQQKTLNVKAITLGYFVMALPQLLDSQDDSVEAHNERSMRQALENHRRSLEKPHDTH